MDAQAVVPRQRQHAIDDLEPLGTIGIVDAGDLHELLIGKPRRVAQCDHRVIQVLATNVESDLADLVDRVEQHAAERGAGRVDRAVIGGIGWCGRPHRSMLPDRRIFRCNCMMPYSSASAVGGHPGT